MEALKSIDFKMSSLDAKISKPPVAGDGAWTKDDVQFMIDLTMQAGRDASATKYNTSELSGYLRQITDNLIAIRNSPNNGSSGSGNGWNQDSISFVQDRLYRSNENEREMIWALQDIKGLLESGSGSGDSGASGIDYSKMPGSGDNPLAVKGGHYQSKCNGKDCFFDVAAMEKQLSDANKALSAKYDDIAKDVKTVFDFNLSGSSGVLECFDLFTYDGTDYRVCPPSKDYWQTLAAMMMFIFYFVALMVIFKR